MLHTLFPSYVYTATLTRRRATLLDLNRRLLAETRELREDDAAGRRWSAMNYGNGYTSYGSVHKLQRVSPTFGDLERRLERHVAAFVAAAEWDMAGRQLAMTDCWVNIMAQRTAHSLHLHPASTLSGTYYVQTPRSSAGIKFEDPRLDRYMAAPPRRSGAALPNRPWVVLPAIAGELVLFESWLRHEVLPHPAARERISISFNYSWF